MSAAETNLGGALVGSLLGAAIGCAAWVGVGYASGSEWGILAVGVGLAVGIGAAMGAKGRAGVPGGVAAALITILAIVAARYTLLQVRINEQIAEAKAEFGDEIPDSSDDGFWTAFIADRIITEREQAGETVEWDWESAEEDDWAGAGYPTDIWMEAQNTWSRLSLTEREEFCAAGAQTILSGEDDYRAVASLIGMLYYNLHPMALIIMGIAVSGAFGVAKNSRPANEHAVETGVDVTAEALAANSATPAPAMTSGFPNMPATLPTMQGGSENAGSEAAQPTRAPTKPVRPYKPAALDESQLPAQFRMKPPEDLPPIRVKRDERDAA